MGFSWIGRVEEVSAPEWDAVLRRSARPSPFLSRRFLVPWATAFAAGRETMAFRWERGGGAAGFLFLCRRADGAGWELLGGERVADSLDAVVIAGQEREFWSGFLRESRGLLAGGSTLRLPNLVEGTPSLHLLPELCGRFGYSFRLEETDRSPLLSLPGDFGEYLERLGKKERHELRRKLRRADDTVPGLSFRITPGGPELDRDLSSFLVLHRSSQSEKERFMDEGMERFFREIAGRFSEAGQLRLAFLSDGETDVASAFQLEWNGSLLLYNSGYDPQYRRISPGLVLLARCIEEAIGRGGREYDFLRGGERYKYDLGGVDRVVYRATVGLP